MSDEKDVLAELGDAAGEVASQDAAAQSAEPESTQEKQKLTKGQERAQRAAATRKRNKQAAEDAAALQAKELSDAGAIPHGVVGSIEGDKIPRDKEGNPLWYLNPKTKRVIPANASLNQVTIRNKMKLMPCMPPESEEPEGSEAA